MFLKNRPFLGDLKGADAVLGQWHCRAHDMWFKAI